MLTRLLVFFLLFPIYTFSQRASVVVDAGEYSLIYSEIYQQPLELSYSVRCSAGKENRYGLDFYRVDSIITSDQADYEKNVWDKGHLAPAATFSCSRETLIKTFSYLNCALQHQDLNRGVWRILEAKERQLVAEFHQVDVHIKLDFSGTPEKLKTGATVPNGFWKILTIDQKEKIIYYFPNQKPAFSDPKKFQVLK
ncbi:DNA/RNA non-specific endonuclease [bacterium]|jgi:DNA/RNA endonuclease G (NUC1)|nr:DNA/RNA non-specific endonuclease [bacterium]